MLGIYSLIDITQTGINRNYRPNGSKLTQEEWDYKRNQQRNWDTVIQLLGLRFQPFDITVPICMNNQRPAAYGFGWIYGPLDDVNIWKFSCRYEHPIDIWTLRGDFDNVPIITGLDETISFPHSCFTSIGDKYLNIVITLLEV
jgi:hypothetical protein